MKESQDKKEWEEFVHRYYQDIYSFCFHFSGNQHDAEDATQATFLKAWSKFSTLRDRNAARGWLYSIARNSCLDQCRWWKRFLGFKNHLSNEHQTDGDSDLARTLETLIAALPLKQREVFILRHWHGFSTEETANMLGIKVGTVKSHLKRAIDSLRQKIIDSDSLETTTGMTETSTNAKKELRI